MFVWGRGYRSWPRKIITVIQIFMNILKDASKSFKYYYFYIFYIILIIHYKRTAFNGKDRCHPAIQYCLVSVSHSKKVWLASQKLILTSGSLCTIFYPVDCFSHRVSPSYDSAPRPPPSSLSRQQVASLSQSSSVSKAELTDRRGEGMGEEPILTTTARQPGPL